MVLSQNLILVFQKENLHHAIRHCQANVRQWTIICAFEVTAGTLKSHDKIVFIDLFSYFPYQPYAITSRVRDIINCFLRDTEIDGKSFDNALSLEGVPPLRAKDNEIMEYTLHRMVFVMEALFEILDRNRGVVVHLLIDRDDLFSVPEWPNVDRLLNLDALYGPVFSQAARALGHSVKLMSVINMRILLMIHRLRELVLIARRFTTILVRAFVWRDNTVPCDAIGPRLAIWVRSKGQIREMEPLVRRWLVEKNLSPFFIQDDSFKKQDCLDYLRSTGDLPFVCVHHFFDFKILGRAIYRYFRFRCIDIHRLKYNSSQPTAKDAVTGVLLSPGFRKELAKSLSETVFSSTIATLELSAIHKHYVFDAMLVMSNYDLWGHIVGYLGQSRGFKTISIQNFLTDPYAFPTPFSLYNAHVVFDVMERDRVIAAGAPADRIHALGGILYSFLRNEKIQTEKRSQIRQSLSIDPEKKIVLLGTQSAAANSVRDNVQGLSLLFDVVSRRRDVAGLVKIHPYEKLTDYQDWINKAAEHGVAIRFFDNQNIDDLIAASDIYISRTSTTMILSVISRKPTISLVNAFEKPRAVDAVEFIRKGLIPIFTDYREAEIWLEGLFDDTGYTKQLQRQEALLSTEFLTYDECGVERIDSLIRKFLVDKKSSYLPCLERSVTSGLRAMEN